MQFKNVQFEKSKRESIITIKNVLNIYSQFRMILIIDDTNRSFVPSAETQVECVHCMIFTRAINDTVSISFCATRGRSVFSSIDYVALICSNFSINIFQKSTQGPEYMFSSICCGFSIISQPFFSKESHFNYSF